MKIDMVAFYTVEYREPDGRISVAHRFRQVPVEIREIGEDEAPVAVVHHFQPQIVGNERYPIPYRRFGDSCLANTEVAAADFAAFNSTHIPDAITRNDIVVGYFERPCTGGYGYVEPGRYSGKWTREAATAEADHAGREIVRSGRSRAGLHCRVLQRELVAIDGVIWRSRLLPELIVLPPSGAKSGGKAVRIHPTVSHPIVEHPLFRPVPTYQEYVDARIDDRLFRIDEEDAAKARAAEFRARLYMPDRFEILDPAALTLDPSKDALEQVGEALLKATDPEDDPIFGLAPFGDARAALERVVDNEDVMLQIETDAATIVPVLRSFLAAFGADERLAEAARRPDLARLIDAAQRVHARTQSRMAAGITSAVSARELDRSDDEALGRLGP